jgi:hypothetical protein
MARIPTTRKPPLSNFDKPKRPKPTEHNEQVAVVQWARLMSAQQPELSLLLSIPNGAKLPYRKNSKGQRYSPEAMKLKAEGLLPGVPDLFLPVARKGYHGAFWELKVGKNVPSEEQYRVLSALNNQGYCTFICYGADALIKSICDYLDIKDDQNAY